MSKIGAIAQSRDPARIGADPPVHRHAGRMQIDPIESLSGNKTHLSGWTRIIFCRIPRVPRFLD